MRNALQTAIASAIIAAATLAVTTSCSIDDDNRYFMIGIIQPSASDGQILQSPSGEKFKEGTKVTFTAVPATGKNFLFWTDEQVGETANPLTVTVTENFSVGAAFGDMYRLTAVPVTDGTGTVEISPGGLEFYTPSTSVTLEAIPSPGYAFIQWQGDLSGTVNSRTFSIKEDTDVKALFGPIGATHQVTVEIAPKDSGTINLEPAAYPEGTIFEFVATPKEGYSLSGISFDGMSATESPAKMTMPAHDASLVVTFRDVSRSFNAQRATDGSWYVVSSTLVAEGDYCNVYVENGAAVTVETAKAVATEFDDNIFGNITTNFGEREDIDGDGKVTLLLLDIVDGYTPSVGSYIAGYFDPSHMLDKDSNAWSNECDMIFVDVNPLKAGSEAFLTTISHEFQHLINYSRTFMVNGQEQDLWVNEGLSSAAEYVYSGKVSADRIGWFNKDPVGSIAEGNNFFVWYGRWEDSSPNSVLDNYATVSLFFQWLRIHASNGSAIYKEILDSANRDYRAVTAAAGNRIDSAYSSWDRLLETWYIASFRCQPSGVYGYKGQISTNPVYLQHQGNVAYTGLEAGEGIISAIGSSFGVAGSFAPSATSTGAHVQYAAFKYETPDIDRVSPYAGEFSLALNANPDNTPFHYENAVLANVAFAPSNGRVARSIQARKDAVADELPGLLRVGFHPGYALSRETAEQKALKNKARVFDSAASTRGRGGR